MVAAWHPPAEVIAATQVIGLARDLRCANFAALRRFSVEQPGPIGELGLTRFGAHPEAFCRGALHGQNPTTPFA
jgi:hypothetical protein